uniref:Uncharacterized protein n=1 Tax=Glossina palpalis gambiensis TaxID=67801 RepID=A0A1B0C6M2_9MUSC
MYKQRVRLSNIYPFCCSAADTRRAWGVFKTSIGENFLKLLASMTFKQCSDRAFEVNSQLAMNAQYAKLRFNDSAATTQIPFAGPSIYNLCEPKCVALYSERDADRKMAKILHMYEEACREDPKIFKSRVKSSKAAVCRRMYLPPPTTFCGDLIRSMKKWKIIKEKHPAVDKSIFETPQNVVNFLKEVRSEWNILHGNCHCSDAFVKELKEGKKLAGSYPTTKSLITFSSSLHEDTSAIEHSTEEFDECPKVKRSPWYAARTIQRFARGWMTRNHLNKQIRASIIIQTEWRRFYSKRLYFRNLESVVQQRTEEHYFRAAQKIQALFRGWWSREYVHDHMNLIRLENTAGMELLHCVAFKLHHLIRTHVIPGIYSLKNTTTLSKVEELLSSISFKDCTDRARESYRHNALRARQSVARHKQSAFSTLLPFYGPNMYNLCLPECTHFYNERDADRKMAKILRMYDTASRLDPKMAKLRGKKCKTITNYCSKPTITFCDDIVRSMRKWRLLKKKKLILHKDVLDDPKSIENFLKEVDSKWNILRGRSQVKDDCCPRTLN